MTWLVSWLVGSKLGRALAVGAVVAGVVVLALAKAFTAGQARERARQARANLDALKTRIRTDDDLARLSAAERRNRLKSWVYEPR
jgi:hypothetical protein